MSSFSSKGVFEFVAGRISFQFRVSHSLSGIKIISKTVPVKDVKNEFQDALIQARDDVLLDYLTDLNEVERAKVLSDKSKAQSYEQYLKEVINVEVINYRVSYPNKFRSFGIRNISGSRRVLIRNRKGKFIRGSGQRFRFFKRSSLNKMLKNSK